MALTISLPPQGETELKPRITVIGCGGAGGNAVNNMIRSQLEGVEFVVCNTDAQALQQSLATRRIQLGSSITRGLGAGSRPEVGRAAAEEAIDEIIEQLSGSNMVFITAGMGGGTGTGAAPVIARAAREHGILTVGVVTKPFQFEGAHRMRLAESGIQDLQQYVDTLIVIPNQNLFRLANERTTFAEAFNMADNVLHQGVRGVTDLMIMPGLINLDFADIRAVMSEMGKAMMGTGEAEGARRALDAAEAAISNPLLEDTSMKGARGVLINITGGLDMTLFEVDEAANRIRDEVDPDANIIFGSTFDQALDGKMRVSVVATGIDVESQSERPARPAISLIAEAGKRTQPGMGSGVGMVTGLAGAQAPAAGVAAVASQPIAASAQAAFAPAMQTGVAAGAMSGAETRYETQGANAIAADPMAQGYAQAFAQPAQRRAEAARGSTATESPFIAPPPVDATSVGQGGEPRAARAAEAAREKPKAPSLFERMTGRRTQPAQPRERAGQNPAQPRLGQLDPAERLTGSQNEDEFLDIPAFLRRQAN